MNAAINVAILRHAWRIPSEIGENPFASSYAIRRVARIASPPARCRHERYLRRMGLYGMEVAHEAFAAAAIPAGPRYGFYVGVGGLRAHWDDMLAGLADQDDRGTRAWERGLKDVHPYWMLRHLSNNVHALASADLGLRGDGATFGGEDAGAHAIRAAIRALRVGAIEAALVVAYDSLLEPETLVERGEREAPDFVAAEAAAAIVLVIPPVGSDHGEHVMQPAALDERDWVTPRFGHVGAARAVVQAIMEVS
jgi:3-oxoacyl-[acyl-carrier-protein] synthase II